jgi:hypothetical protein
MSRQVMLVIVCALAGVACSAPQPSPTAVATATPTPGPTATNVPVLAWPADSAIALTPGRYRSTPPFDIPFTIDIPQGEWGSAHLNPEFFDFMNVTELGVEPTRWVAFAHPESIWGPGAASTAGLAPRAAAELLAQLDDVVAGPVSDVTLAGTAGARIDLSTRFPNVHLFGGPGGQFGLDPDYELRLTVLPHNADDDLLLILVLAPRGELEAAWAEIEPILETIRL